jgi:hypothetical protein
MLALGTPTRQYVVIAPPHLISYLRRDLSSELLFCSILALLTFIVGDRVGHIFVQIIGEIPFRDSGPEFDGKNAFCLALVGRDVAAVGAGGGRVEHKVVQGVEKSVNPEFQKLYFRLFEHCRILIFDQVN